MIVRHVRTFAAAMGLLVLAAPASAQKPPATWDGLVQVPSKRLDLVYLQPGADFRPYSKVMLEPTEVAFRKNWQRDYNRETRSVSGRISERQMEDAITGGVAAASDIFAKAFTNGGYTVVTTPGPDVLKVRTGVVNITLNAPDVQTAGRSYSFANEAGSATLFVEARDSETGAILGRAVDQRWAGDNRTSWRTSASNRADFRDLVEEWAKTTIKGMAELKALSPVAN